MDTNIKESNLHFFILSEVVENNINEPQIFFSYEDAIKELESRINDNLLYLSNRYISINDVEIWDEMENCGCTIYADQTCSVFGQTKGHENISWTITPHTIRVKLSCVNL